MISNKNEGREKEKNKHANRETKVYINDDRSEDKR